MKLFDKIRILRKARGLSQEQLGYSLSRVNKDGISRQTVSDWENGKFEPKLENIRDLAEVFNVSFDALLDESDSMEPSDVKEHLTVPEVACQVVLTSLSCLLETEELPQDLYERHLGGQLFYLIKAAAVDVLVGEGVQQVVPGLDAQLGFQSLSPRWANAWNVGDGLLLQVFHLFKVTRRCNLNVFPIPFYH